MPTWARAGSWQSLDPCDEGFDIVHGCFIIHMEKRRWRRFSGHCGGGAAATVAARSFGFQNFLENFRENVCSGSQTVFQFVVAAGARPGRGAGWGCSGADMGVTEIVKWAGLGRRWGPRPFGFQNFLENFRENIALAFPVVFWFCMGFMGFIGCQNQSWNKGTRARTQTPELEHKNGFVF